MSRADESTASPLDAARRKRSVPATYSPGKPYHALRCTAACLRFDRRHRPGATAADFVAAAIDAGECAEAPASMGAESARHLQDGGRDTDRRPTRTNAEARRLSRRPAPGCGLGR